MQLDQNSGLHFHAVHDVWFLILNNVQTRNALSPTMVEALDQVLNQALNTPQLRALVLRGNQGFFSAGGNIGSFKERLSQANKDELIKKNRVFGAFLEKLQRLQVPIVSVVEGAAVGGGMGLACAADIVISTKNTKFALTETRLGLIPAQIYPFVVQRLGAMVTKRLSLTGTRLDGSQAYALGLVDVLADENAINTQLAEVLNKILACAPLANQEIKKLDTQLAQLNLHEFLNFSASRFADCLQQEGAEGVNAFKEKRSPSWQVSLTEEEILAALPQEE